MSELPSRPCRGCGTPFWTQALYCPQCGLKRWEPTCSNEYLQGPGWFNFDTGEQFEGEKICLSKPYSRPPAGLPSP